MSRARDDDFGFPSGENSSERAPKRQDGSSTMMAEKKPHERWRLMGKVVKAMNRFKASLNPDVDFKGNVAIKHAQNHGSDEAPQLSRGYGSLQRYSSGGSPTLASENENAKKLAGGHSFRNRGHKTALILGK